MLPFDGTASYIAGQLSNSSSTPFPPPLACYPSLNKDAMSRLNTIETSVFGLQAASAVPSLQTSCYPDRPVYGILNVLRLRHPFIDSRHNVAQQAAVMTHDVWPRVVVYSGEALSALPSATDAPSENTYSTDPRTYGTLANVNHVLLRWFASINDVSLATAIVQFMLSSSTAPPPQTSLVYQKLAAIPPLEVAVFGSVLPGDVGSVVAGWVRPDGSLYFGSPEALALRQWAINAVNAQVVWAPNATSALVVRDSTLPGDSALMSLWGPAEKAVAQNATYDANGMKITDTITAVFTADGEFVP